MISEASITSLPASQDETGLLELIKLLETGLVITNSQSQVLLWNNWMERVTGIKAQEANNRSLAQLFSQPPSPALLDAIEQACNDRLSRRLSHQLHPFLLPLSQPASGQQLHHSILARPMKFAGQSACLLQINDVTNTVRREQHLRDAEALLRFEKEILSLVAHNQPIESVWQALTTGMQKLAPGSEAGLLLLDEHSQYLTNPVTSSHGYLPSQLTVNSQTPAGAAARTGRLQLAEFQNQEQPAFWWCHPLTTSEERLAGVLQLAWPATTQEPTASLTLLERSAQLAAIALQNHQQLLQVRYLAQHDALTGLANRSLLNDRLQDQCVHARQKQQGFALLFIDLDGFKSVNDEYGHDAGDALLIELSRRLQKHLDSRDLVARLGGDELVVLSQQTQTQHQAFALAEQLNDLLSQPFDWQGFHLQAGASIGIALFPDQGDTANKLLTQADNAMYLAKSRGKGQAASCDLSAVVYNEQNSNSEG
ncbi:diguanylate cyclase domain-containing protein [Marinospirillum sp.]|uniref:diguanylate cyclase domain-containing protein n=1 Tax=Marinospirillum sp. TaxID=2183934 RepID=UPI00286FD119|nr:diguanylate cyclase [Marinospirillum sp.]MDR9468525.1 diguanylate cyclase [Marinospirillum sp.]